jgi:hypothetical protein
MADGERTILQCIAAGGQEEAGDQHAPRRTEQAHAVVFLTRLIVSFEETPKYIAASGQRHSRAKNGDRPEPRAPH